MSNAQQPLLVEGLTQAGGGGTAIGDNQDTLRPKPGTCPRRDAPSGSPSVAAGTGRSASLAYALSTAPPSGAVSASDHGSRRQAKMATGGYSDLRDRSAVRTLNCLLRSNPKGGCTGAGLATWSATLPSPNMEGDAVGARGGGRTGVERCFTAFCAGLPRWAI